MKLISLKYTVFSVALICLQTTAMEQPIVVACSFNTFNKEADSASIIKQAMQNPRTAVSCLPPKTMVKITANIESVNSRGCTIAKTTKGTTNIIKKLFQELEAARYGQFSNEAIRQICNFAITPIPDKEALEQIKQIKRLNLITLLIGSQDLVGSQDSLEYEIFVQKMKNNHKIELHTIFDGVVTIPTLEEQEQLKQTNENYLAHTTHWLVTKHPAHSQEFKNTVTTLAQQFNSNPLIYLAHNKPLLLSLVRILKQLIEQGSISTEDEQVLANANLSSLGN